MLPKNARLTASADFARATKSGTRVTTENFVGYLYISPVTNQNLPKCGLIINKSVGGSVMRHALAPGSGEPAGFVLENCSTQRNLNDEGRQQAERWGDLLRAQHSGVISVYSSQWCRCLDTARLAFGHATAWPAINSTFQGQGDADQGVEQAAILTPVDLGK